MLYVIIIFRLEKYNECQIYNVSGSFKPQHLCNYF